MGFKQTPGNGDYTRTENKLELTDPYSWCPSLCIDSSKDQIYIITLGQSESTFVSIDKKGFTSTLATLPVKSGNATSALTYFPETGYFLWNCYDNGVSALYAIKLTDGGCTCEKISDLAENEHYSFFVTDKCADGVGVPALPEMVLDNFEAPSTSGSIMYVAPMMDLADEYIENDSWEMGYTVLLDGEEYKTGIIGIGSTETIEYTDIEQGEHTFGFYMTFEGMNSGTVKFKKYIGYDTPLAPQNVLLVREDDTKVTATWDAVTEGVHQAYIDTEAMEYKVFFNGTLMTTVKETTWSGELDLNAPLTANIVSIVATANGHDSESASSNAIVAGQPLTLPVSIAPTEADAALMTYPASESGTWKYNTSFDPAVFSVSAMYGSYEDLNSWLILPAIEFSDASASYTLSYQNDTYASYDEESYEIWIGKKATPEDMTTQIQKLTEIIPSDNYSDEVVWNDNTVDFTVPEAGVWFIGFRAIAEQGNIGQVLLNINVTGTSGVKTIGENADKEVAAYYDAHGVRLQNRPERGFYITVFTDGTVKKNMSAR